MFSFTCVRAHGEGRPSTCCVWQVSCFASDAEARRAKPAAGVGVPVLATSGAKEPSLTEPLLGRVSLSLGVSL